MWRISTIISAHLGGGTDNRLRFGFYVDDKASNRWSNECRLTAYVESPFKAAYIAENACPAISESATPSDAESPTSVMP